MNPRSLRMARNTLLGLAFAIGVGLAGAVDATGAIEQALAGAQQSKRGVTLHVQGQAVSGAVTHVEPGQWVELRSPQFGRIVVRLDRIDAVAAN